MEKSEIKGQLDSAERYLAKGQHEQTLDILDSINWKKIRNVNMLLLASDLYEKANAPENARELLETAHDRSPIGRMIIFRLALLSLKLGDISEAEEYYDEFVEIAPHDSLKYVIRYQIQKARNVDPYTLISTLEELKTHDFIEEWAFELACLYRQTSQVDKCINMCDEIILWFGEGPYVEKALEMKMLYQPLDKDQEDKYRAFQHSKDNLTEIRPEDSGRDEILSHTIQIPRVELNTDKFNTINLQAEIKKNIEEIMQATEAGEITENMEMIKGLVEDIPYLTATGTMPFANLTPEQDKKEKEAFDDSLRDVFKGYLEEEYDGQYSIPLPDYTEMEEQVAGQMTISEVMDEWEKTKRAVEAALQDAEKEKLEIERTRALEEANQIMDRLVDVSPRLEAGVAPETLLKEQYLGETLADVNGILQEQIDSMTGELPDISSVEDAENFVDKPVIPADIMSFAPGAEQTEPDEDAEVVSTEDAPVEEPEAEAEETAVQEEVPAEEPAEEPATESLDTLAVAGEFSDDIPAAEELRDEEQEAGEEVFTPEYAEAVAEPEYSEAVSEPEYAQTEPVAEMPVEEAAVEMPEQAAAYEPEIYNAEDAENYTQQPEQPEEPEIYSAEDAEHFVQEPEQPEPVEEPEIYSAEDAENFAQQPAGAGTDTIPLPKIEYDPVEFARTREFANNEVEAVQSAAQGRSPKAPVSGVHKAGSFSLSDEQRQILSYFAPVHGMEETLYLAINGAEERLRKNDRSMYGNIMIIGKNGSGRTTLAADLIEIIRMDTGLLSGITGRITGANLNQKDLQQVYDKIRGGCLIIEEAGQLNRETAVSLSLLMENDKGGTLVILEDKDKGYRRLRAISQKLIDMFTERIEIPDMTIDELVNFGKVYIKEQGYTMDDMAVLALYDKINIMQHQGTTIINLTTIRNILEDALAHAKDRNSGLFGLLSPRNKDDSGNRMLIEKDFV